MEEPIEDGWATVGYVLVKEFRGISRLKVAIGNNVYEMQSCYFEPIMQKFSLRINDEMNPKFDYLDRFIEMEYIMKSRANSALELKLRQDNEELGKRIEFLERELEFMRNSVNDTKIAKEMPNFVSFDSV